MSIFHQSLNRWIETFLLLVLCSGFISYLSHVFFSCVGLLKEIRTDDFLTFQIFARTTRFSWRVTASSRCPNFARSNRLRIGNVSTSSKKASLTQDFRWRFASLSFGRIINRENSCRIGHEYNSLQRPLEFHSFFQLSITITSEWKLQIISVSKHLFSFHLIY